MKISGKEFDIIYIHVDDINIIETPEEFPKAINFLKKWFDVKDLEKTKFLQGEHLDNRICVHQESYIEKVLKRFYMKKILYITNVKMFLCGKISCVVYFYDGRSLDV